MTSILGRIFGSLARKNAGLWKTGNSSASAREVIDVAATGFPLIPDDYHLKYVGRTAQGNGYWITSQLTFGDSGTRDFVAAYVFDPKGNLISSEVIDLGLQSRSSEASSTDIVEKLKKKIDAVDISEIWVKPFSVSFYGQSFGLIIRQPEDDEAPLDDTLVDAMPGYTLMFYGPWDQCNYDS